MPYEAENFDYNLLSEDNIKKYILPHYSLEDSDVTQIKFKDTDKQRAVYRINKENKVFCLKKVYYDIEELLFVYSSIEWLYRNNIYVPRILPTKKGGRFVKENDMLFILTPWVEGTKCNYDNIDNIMDSALNLSKMHEVCKNFYPVKGSNLRTGYENICISTKKHFEQLLSCSNSAFKYKDKFSKLYLQHFDTAIKLARLALDVSFNINVDNLSKTLCHGDYVNKNIIFDPHNNLWVIDFDKCKLDYSVHDISYFLRRILKRDNTKWDLEVAVNSLNIYEKIRPLSLDEYRYILVYLAFPQKYWKISRDYYNNIKKCNKTSFYTLLSKAVSKNDFQTDFAFEFKNYIDKKFNL